MGATIGAPFALALHGLGLPVDHFLMLMFAAGAYADSSFLFDVDRRGRLAYHVYHYTHQYIDAYYSNYWLPIVWPHNLHVWIDHGTDFHTEGKEYWVPGTFAFYCYVATWAVYIVGGYFYFG